MTTTAQIRDYLTIAEAAMKLGVSAPTIRRWVRNGELPAAQPGGPGTSIRVRADDLHVSPREVEK